jgi:hypothetical protein
MYTLPKIGPCSRLAYGTSILIAALVLGAGSLFGQDWWVQGTGTWEPTGTSRFTYPGDTVSGNHTLFSTEQRYSPELDGASALVNRLGFVNFLVEDEVTTVTTPLELDLLVWMGSTDLDPVFGTTAEVVVSIQHGPGADILRVDADQTSWAFDEYQLDLILPSRSFPVRDGQEAWVDLNASITTGTQHPIPEPAAVALVLVGLIAMYVRRKF